MEHMNSEPLTSSQGVQELGSQNTLEDQGLPDESNQLRRWRKGNYQIKLIADPSEKGVILLDMGDESNKLVRQIGAYNPETHEVEADLNFYEEKEWQAHTRRFLLRVEVSILSSVITALPGMENQLL
jgi:hypothetical protein